MHMTVLGCRAGMPADGQPSSGYLVDSTSTRVLLDCGPGVALSLSAHAAADTLDAVVITHLHLDHCYDLLPIGKSILMTVAEYPDSEKEPQAWAPVTAVPLYVPAGGKAVLDRLSELFPVSTVPLLNRAFELAFDVREYQPGDSFTVAELEVSLHGLRHSAPNCGVRLTDEIGTLAYTGDTGLTAALQSLADEADMLLAEASLTRTDHGPHGHLSAIDAAEAAERAGVGSLVLTHFPSAEPEWLRARAQEAASAFSGAVYVAQPGDTFELSPARVVAGTSAMRAEPASNRSVGHEPIGKALP